ncbi:RagB/SusD family nutrient uptake outer membrane protein [Desertivirga arenae]|uniref:RagB/SusD family nutrient uptake outer membrane protein n=1 Tax=Desertivirga arenae TaxID=2810309 RepID=UPI001A959E87|nr:RagB/SusD family nutrient uptake outer membrane protein [Pedobacter sp. SYSU D00823]
MRYMNRSKELWMLPLALALLLSACKKDFLEQKKLSAIDEEGVFSDSIRSRGMLNNLYSNIGMSFNSRRYSNTPLDAATDDAEPNLYDNAIATFYTYRLSNGAINSSNTDKDVWTRCFQMIRAANIYIKNKDKVPVTNVTKDFWHGQVRFLRAWYYFTLLKHYGGIPLIGDKVFEGDELIDVQRSSYEDCVNYIVSELDAAAALLPATFEPGSQENLRVSKGTALAVKSRVLLYAASPLFNAGARADDPDHYVSYPSSDNERWKKAADAAKAVISLNVYRLYTLGATPFYEQFLKNVPQDLPEAVFLYWQPQNTANNFYVENSANPVSRGTNNGYQGSAKYVPTQELVDAFGMKNGLPISDPASGYTDGDNMYKNRDPRLTFTVHYNGALRYMGGAFGDQPVYTYTGVIPVSTNRSVTSAIDDGMYRPTGTPTGYFRFKSMNNFGTGSGSELYRPWTLMRYAEVLLNAAEATNEYSGPSAEVYGWLKEIRERAKIDAGANGLFGLKANMTREEMRDVIRNERRTELAFEEHRFWDVRRWKIAPETENRETHGMEITRDASGKYSYRRVVVRKHTFTDAMYFFPIPQSEIVRSPALKQNPGY